MGLLCPFTVVERSSWAAFASHIVSKCHTSALRLSETPQCRCEFTAPVTYCLSQVGVRVGKGLPGNGLRGQLSDNQSQRCGRDQHFSTWIPDLGRGRLCDSSSGRPCCDICAQAALCWFCQHTLGGRSLPPPGGPWLFSAQESNTARSLWDVISSTEPLRAL